ncbi:MAG: FkbM family methyltransferase [Pseudomonadota bacterium]|nr:FkbM family methyltransferase [Pseudomonadota bacterium]
MKPIRVAVESAAKTFGYSVIPNWRLPSYPQTQYLRRLFDYSGIETVIDAGANEGQYRDYLRNEVGYSGDIVSIEPIPHLVDKLRARASGDPHWRIEGCALAAMRGSATLNVMGGSQFSSLLAPDHSEIGLFSEQNVVVQRVEVETRTLDELMAGITRSDLRNVYLKLDTQGSDLEALKGGIAALRRVAALQTEASFKRIYRGAPGHIEVVNFLHEHGFEMSAAYPNNAGHFPVLVELDLHLISRELIPASHQGTVQ